MRIHFLYRKQLNCFLRKEDEGYHLHMKINLFNLFIQIKSNMKHFWYSYYSLLVSEASRHKMPELPVQ